MSKFVVIDFSGDIEIVESDDIQEALEKCYNYHYGYSGIISITKIPEEDEE